MSTLVPFEYGDQPVRTIVIDDEPWFVAPDVARILGYSEASAMTRTLDDDEKGLHSVQTPGGPQTVTVVSEPGLYSAILRSRVDGARMFKRWVTHEVLPALRRTGTYTVPAQPFELPQTFSEALRALADTHEAMELAEAKVAALEPAASAWSVMAEAHGDYAVDEAAKILSRDERIEIGRTRLFALMADLRWIYRSGARGRWHAYQAQVDRGRLVQKMAAAFLNQKTGQMENPAPTIRVTAKGLESLRAHLLAEVA